MAKKQLLLTVKNKVCKEHLLIKLEYKKSHVRQYFLGLTFWIAWYLWELLRVRFGGISLKGEMRNISVQTLGSLEPLVATVGTYLIGHFHASTTFPVSLCFYSSNYYAQIQHICDTVSDSVFEQDIRYISYSFHIGGTLTFKLYSVIQAKYN